MKAILSARIQHRLVVTSMWIAAICCVLLSLTPVQAQQQVGYVVDFEGRWFLNSGQPITRKGQSLPGGGTVSRHSASEYDYIAIADLNGRIVAHKSCKTRSECDSPVKLAAPPRRRGFLRSAFGAVMSLVWAEPDRYVPTRSRDGELRDGVVEMKGERINLSTIFNTTDAGKYHLRFAQVAQGAKQPTHKSVGPIAWDWDPKHESSLPVPGLHHGLYELVLLEYQNGVYSPTDVTAWILISRPKGFEKSRASFEQAVSLTKTWGNEVTPEAARAFLRAHLDQLARTSVK